MRPLTDDEMRTFFEKLRSYLGQDLARLVDRKDEPYTFRLVKDRIYYLSEAQMKLATNIGRDHLISLGTCFGKFTKAGKFHLHMPQIFFVY
jgi:60S ribosome subunit biogenesis protein NIP7